MLGHAELGLMSSNPEERTESLRIIQIAALQARDLTDQMLAYAGKGPFLLKDFDLAEVARELVRLVGAGHSRQVRWSVDGARAGVRGDTSQIRQVLLNLLTNAADAIGDSPGEVIVTIERIDALPDGPWIHQSEHSGPLALLTVSDDGVDGSRGLGMAAVLGIIDKHSGSLRVESAPDKGSTFQIALPWIALDEDRSAAPDVAQRRILVADNEPAISTFLGVVLERHGHEVVLVSDGAEALAALRAGRFDACVLDVLMPALAGPEVVRTARSEGIRVPTLLISGFTQRYSVLSEPDVAFLQKPLGASDLLQALRALLA
jgi:two-component system cell cycle sensor histidine kinase/response regulator CckA